jgi:hypothetical protein
MTNFRKLRSKSGSETEQKTIRAKVRSFFSKQERFQMVADWIKDKLWTFISRRKRLPAINSNQPHQVPGDPEFRRLVALCIAS